MDHYSILGLLPDPEGGVSDITGLFLAKFNLLPVGQRIFIRTVQQINGWRDLLWEARREIGLKMAA